MRKFGLKKLLLKSSQRGVYASVSFSLRTITISCILDLSNYLNILLLWLGVTGSNAGRGSEVFAPVRP